MTETEKLRNYLISRLREEAEKSGYDPKFIPDDTGEPVDLDQSVSQTLDTLAAHTHLLYGCATIQGLAEEAIDEAVSYIERALSFIRQNSPYASERDLWQRCEAFDDGTFDAHWDRLHPYLGQRYTPSELNIHFFVTEFEAVLGPEYPLLRRSFLEDWDRALWLKEMAYELEILNRVRRQLERVLTTRITAFFSTPSISAIEVGLLWGGSPGTWDRTTLNLISKIRALCYKNQSIRTLLDALGRKGAESPSKETGYEEHERQSHTRFPTATRSDIEGVGESNRLDALLPSEVALLGERQLEDTFYKKFVERRLQTFDFRSHIRIREQVERPSIATERKGPYIVCIDTSGSMMGKPEEVAKAICYGLIEQSRAEGRNCYVITFSTRIEVLDLSNLRENRASILDFLTHSFNGGTDLTEPFRHAIEMLRSEEFSLADVLFISDFIAPPLPDYLIGMLVSLQQRNVQFHALSIGWMGQPHLLQLFDVWWLYRHRANRIDRLSLDKMLNLREEEDN